MSSSASSKSDYLKRYTDASSADADSKKKRKKKSDNIDGYPAAKAKAVRGMRMVDEDDDDMLAAIQGKSIIVSDDKPVTTEGVEGSVSKAAKPKGVWESVPFSGVYSRTLQTAVAPSVTAVSSSSSFHARHDSDSDSDAEVPRRPVPVTYGDPAETAATAAAASVPERALTASGMATGLLTGTQFAEAEAAARRKNDAALGGVDAHALGKGQETVYRDRRGRKLDALNEFMRQQAVSDGAAARLEAEVNKWGMGAKQQEDAVARQI